MSKPELEILIEEYVSKLLREIFDGIPDELNVYDFDDTLCRTEGMVHVINNETGETKDLHPHEFHEYHLQEGEEFDLSDFGVIINPETLPHLERMKADYDRLGPYGVSICTARPSATEVIKFMADCGMPDIEIVAVGTLEPHGDVGNLNALRKQSYLRGKLEQRNLKVLRFFDDNELNIEAAQHLQKEFPNVHMEIELVK